MALSPQAIWQYAQVGYVSPIGVQSPAQAQRYRLEAIEAFARLPAGGLLDAVASRVGPNILVWGRRFFISMAKVDSEVAANRLRACRRLDALASRPVDRRS